MRRAPITNAANAMPITVRVSRPWKIGGEIGLGSLKLGPVPLDSTS